MGKKVKQKFCHRNNKYWADKAERIQTAVDTTGVKVLTQSFERCLHGPYPLRANDGNNLICNPNCILRRWRERFDVWLTFASSGNEGILNSIPKVMLIKSWSLSCHLVRQMLLSCGRSPGLDNICTGLGKHGGRSVTKCLHSLIQDLWVKECIPDDWTAA